MLLLFVVVVLNVLNDFFNVVDLSGLAKRLPTRMTAIFLPSEGMKQRINVEAGANPAPVAEGVPLVPQPVEAPVEQAQPEPVPEAPAEEAPVEEVPAEEPPAAGSPRRGSSCRGEAPARPWLSLIIGIAGTPCRRSCDVIACMAGF